MSAYFAIAGADRSYLFTDGAGYSNDGVVRTFTQKVACAETVPFAITTLGNAELGERIRRFLAAEAERLGVDDFFELFLPVFLAGLQESYAGAPSSRDTFVLAMISAWSESKGAFHTGFQTVAEDHRDDIVPFKLRDLGRTTMRGPIFPVLKMATVRKPYLGEDQDQYARELGIEVMGFMRDQESVPIHMKGTNAPARFYVGGHVDMTIVDAAGARVERIHVWDDKIGQLIDPHGANRTVLPFTGNRAQRRAAARLGRVA